MKFRKKPVVVDAMQYTQETAEQIREFVGMSLMRYGGNPIQPATIRTMEGDMRANVGDWIIRGVNGEFYPCKPDIFAKTYEPVLPDPKEVG